MRKEKNRDHGYSASLSTKLSYPKAAIRVHEGGQKASD